MPGDALLLIINLHGPIMSPVIHYLNPDSTTIYKALFSLVGFVFYFTFIKSGIWLKTYIINPLLLLRSFFKHSHNTSCYSFVPGPLQCSVPALPLQDDGLLVVFFFVDNLQLV